MGFVGPSRHFQCLALGILSYINGIVGVECYLWGLWWSEVEMSRVVSGIKLY